jgi:hypothetical protein
LEGGDEEAADETEDEDVALHGGIVKKYNGGGEEASVIYVRFTARTPLQHSRGHPMVVRGLGSFAVDGHVGNSTFSAGGRTREVAAESVFHSLEV